MYMCRNLEDMTLEELWQLFPIALVPHQPEWKDWAKIEIESLGSLLCDYKPIINHIGSTAISRIYAKPIIDILIEIPDKVDWDIIKLSFENAGYICMSFSESRMSFNKGYTLDGYADKVFHVHVHAEGDNDEISFRNYLMEDSATAREYEKLKCSLLPKFRTDRDGYTAAKSEFVKRVLSLVKSRDATLGLWKGKS